MPFTKLACEHMMDDFGSAHGLKLAPAALLQGRRRIAKNRQMHDYAIIFSWHIADELAQKLKAEGFRGQLIAPSPIPRVL